MKEYKLKFIRIYFLPTVICALLGAALALFALTGIQALIVIFAPLLAAAVLVTTAVWAEIMQGCKIILTDKKLLVCVPKILGGKSVDIKWEDINNITFAHRKFCAKNISVNSWNKSAVFPLTAFKNNIDLLKAIIRRSCNNDGFYAEQKVLEFLKNA